MESSKFQWTRFTVCGLLAEGNKPGVEVAEYRSFIEKEKQAQQDVSFNVQSEVAVSGSTDTVPGLPSNPIFGGETKELTSVLSCLSKVTIRRPEDDTLTEMFMMKIHYDEHQYKTIVVLPETSAMEVCASLASKLFLKQFTFRLYVIRNQKELHYIPDNDSVSHFLEKLELSKPNSDLKIQVLRPRPTGINLSMRKMKVDRLKSDLADGSVICTLAEILAEGLQPKYPDDADAARKLDAAFKTLNSIGIEIQRDEAVANILSGSSEKICKVLWSILYRFAISMKCLGSENQLRGSQVSEFIYMEELYNWCSRLMASHKDIQLVDFNASWRDGLAWAALLENYDKYRVSYVNIKEMESVSDRLDSLFYAFEKYFDLPPILSPKELLLPPKEIDDNAVIIFLTFATMILHSKAQVKSRRSSMMQMAPEIGGGHVPTKVFVEGIEGLTHKVLLLPKETTVGIIRSAILQKMQLTLHSFWLCITENGVESVPPDEETVTLSDKISITIKMVSGSSFYNKEAISPSVTRVRTRQRSSSDPLLELRRRSSLLFRKKKE